MEKEILKNESDFYKAKFDEYLKDGKAMYLLDVEHLPFHDSSVTMPNKECYLFFLEKNRIIDMGKFRLKVADITENAVKFIVFDNEGVRDVQNIVDYNKSESELTLKRKEDFILSNVDDAMECWTLKLLVHNEPVDGLYDKFNENRRKLDPNAKPITTREEFIKELEKMKEED